MGDNSCARSDLRVYRIPEPDLNGVEVARRGLGQPGIVPAFDEAAALREAGEIETIPVCCEPLASRRNVLAFEVHNATLTSTDLSFDPALVARVAP